MFSSNFKAFLHWKTDYLGYLSGPIASKKYSWKKTHKKLQLSIVQNHGNQLSLQTMSLLPAKAARESHFSWFSSKSQTANAFKMHKRARSLLNWQLFLFLFSKGEKGIKKKSVFCYFGASKDKMALGQVNLQHGETLGAAEGEWFCIFIAKVCFLFRQRPCLFQGETEMY